MRQGPDLLHLGCKRLDTTERAELSQAAAQLVKNPGAMWETWVQSLVGRSSGKEKGCSVFWPPQRIHGLYQSPRNHRVGLLSDFHFLSSRHFRGKWMTWRLSYKVK